METRAIVIINGRVVLDGGVDLIKRIDTTGYEFIKTELGIEIAKEEANMNSVSIGSCAVREVTRK
jgi:Fe-S cluster assembly ATP-binding protein